MGPNSNINPEGPGPFNLIFANQFKPDPTTIFKWPLTIIKGGVEDTRLKAKAKKTKQFRGQGQEQTLSRPRTKDTDASVFQNKKKVLEIFFQAISKKKVFADFPQGFWRFPTKFQPFKNSAILEPRTGQFSRI